jgi:hypothetical protein
MECRRLIEMRSDCLSGNRVSVVTLVLDHYFIISAGLLLRQPLGPIRSLPCQRFLERHGNASSIDELRPWSSAYYARTAHPARSACRHRRAHAATSDTHQRNVRHPSVRARAPIGVAQRQTPIGSCASTHRRSRASRPPAVSPTNMTQRHPLFDGKMENTGEPDTSLLIRLAEWVRAARGLKTPRDQSL